METNAALKNLSSHLTSQHCLRQFLKYLCIYFFSAGVIILLLRFIFHSTVNTLLVISAGMAVGAIAYVIKLLTYKTNVSALYAIIDGKNNFGGLLMASEEIPLDKEWIQRISETIPLRVKSDMRKPFWTILASLAFCTGAMYLPLPETPVFGTTHMDVKERIDEIKNRIDNISTNQIIEEERANELKDELNEIMASADAKDPTKTWEAIDSIENKSVSEMIKAAETIAATDAALDDAQDILDDISESMAKGEQSAIQRDKSMELAQILENKFGQDMAGLEMTPEMREALKNFKLTDQQMKDLMNILSKAQMANNLKLEDLKKLKFIDPANLKFREGGEGSEDCTNALLLALSTTGMGGTENPDDASSGLPGRGGRDRGRGDAPMTWQDKISEENFKFTEKTLPPPKSGDFDRASTIMETYVAPKTDTASSPSAPGSLKVAENGSVSHQQVVFPEHRKSVTKYFSRKTKEQSSENK